MSQPRAYYNEIDPQAAEWLRNLIAAGHIAAGDVDERSIEDVNPDDLRSYTQCHFFAGIGVWSYALRRAGWPDDRPVWTGSCPCQPFSSSGQRKGFADERHLWPAWHHLIRECRPRALCGEQVASKDGLAWLDLVSADLEGEDYAQRFFDLCAAGVGSPHIRQRLYFCAYDLRPGLSWMGDSNSTRASAGIPEPEEREKGFAEVYDDAGRGFFGHLGRGREMRTSGGGSVRMAHGNDAGQSAGSREGESGRDDEAWDDLGRRGEAGRVADNARHGRPQECADAGGVSAGDRAQGVPAGFEPGGGDLRPGPTNGFWGPADWLLCADPDVPTWRPVEPGTFPLDHGIAARVVRLRAYGNAIVAPLAEEFVRAFEASLREIATVDRGTAGGTRPGDRGDVGLTVEDLLG